jgi:hypothetical protein
VTRHSEKAQFVVFMEKPRLDWILVNTAHGTQVDGFVRIAARCPEVREIRSSRTKHDGCARYTLSSFDRPSTESIRDYCPEARCA